MRILVIGCDDHVQVYKMVCDGGQEPKVRHIEWPLGEVQFLYPCVVGCLTDRCPGGAEKSRPVAKDSEAMTARSFNKR